MERNFELLKEVLSIPTKTYQEGLMVEFIVNWLDKNNIPCYVDQFNNVYATKQTDENIEFVSGAESIQSIEEKITKGKFKVDFILYPIAMDQVKRVADNQMIMPPKSTWVEPKMRSGLTIYNINE